MTSRLIAMTGTASVVLALAGCGGTVTTSSGAGSESASVEARDFEFSPTTLTLPTNATVNLTVKNAGSVHHNFSIKELGVNKDVETPGKAETVTFSTKVDATYTFYCEYHRDSKGMKGTVTIGSGGAGAAPTSASPAASPSGSGY
jgi:plastocyanin